MAYADVILATPNLAAYYRLGEPSGTTAEDSGPNGLDLTYRNTPTLGATGLLTDDADTAIEVNGSSQYADRNAHAALQGGSALTVECWIDGDTTGNKCPVGLFGSGSDKGWWFNNATKLGFWISTDGSAQVLVESPDNTVTGQTYYVAATYDGETMRLYVDGVEVATNTTPSGAIHTVTTSGAFAVGRLGALSADYFDGTVDEVAIYNRVLTASEIADHYQAGINPTPDAVTRRTTRLIAPTEVTIARPGFFDRHILQISPPSLSWRTDGPGSFGCEVSQRQLHLAGIDAATLKGKWLYYEHPTAGNWGGVVTRVDWDRPFARITAEQFNVLMRKRRVPGNYRAISMSPGALALAFYTNAERNGDSFLLTGASVQATGDAIDFEPRGSDLCDDILPLLASFGYQWRVRTNTMDERLFEFRNRLGIDRRASVLLSEGRQIVRFNQTGDLWSVANSVEGVPGDRPYQDARGYQLDDNASIRALGRRYEVTIPYSGVATRSTIVPFVKRDLERMRYPQEIAQADIVDAELCWLKFREGDIVTVASEAADWWGPMDVDIRTLDVRSGIMSIAGRLRTEDVA